MLKVVTVVAGQGKKISITPYSVNMVDIHKGLLEDLPIEISKGSVFGLWVAPDNIRQASADTFRQFKLWVNRNGVCGAGMELPAPIRSETPYLVFSKLPLPNDYVKGFGYVSASVSKWIASKGVYNCIVYFQDTPLMTEGSNQASPLMNEILTALKNVNTALEKNLELFDGSFSAGVLSQINAGGSPLIPLPSWNAAILPYKLPLEQSITALKQTIIQVEAKKW